MESPNLASRNLKQQGSYCMKCLELLDMINLWEVGVDGAARNFSRIRRELENVSSGLQQLEKLVALRSKDCSSNEEMVLLDSLKNSAKKAMDISHKAASACFQKAKPDLSPTDSFRNSRGYSFAESSPKLRRSKFCNTAKQVDIMKTLSKDSVVSGRPASMIAGANPVESCHSSNGIEDGLENRLFTISSDHYKMKESKNSKPDYTQWTILDPPEHMPEGLQSKQLEPYRTHIDSAGEIRKHRSELLAVPHSHSEGECQKPGKCDDETDQHPSLVSPCLSDTSDSDIQLERVMSKITDLEEERLQLMQTIEMLQSDNLSIRQSLRETLGTLEMKDVQLKLAMQDLGAATGEIKRASELNGKLRTLEREKGVYIERLAVLEDESSAVKLSLIQLLQDKSAVNKNLVLENFQLQQQLTLKNPSSDDSRLAQDSLAEQSVDQTDSDSGLVIHKQGFLVKRGGRVRSWRKRLFVLNGAGLSYYKTEQPISHIPLSDIVSASVSREVVPLVQNLFEVHTASRTYLCGASTCEEMQSWVGMLQTLTQYCRKHGVVGVCPGKESDEDASDKENNDHDQDE